MQRLEVSGAVQPLYGSLGVKGLSVIRWCVYYTSTLFGQTVRPSSGSQQIHIIKVSPKRDLSFDEQ